MKNSRKRCPKPSSLWREHYTGFHSFYAHCFTSDRLTPVRLTCMESFPLGITRKRQCRLSGTPTTWSWSLGVGSLGNSPNGDRRFAGLPPPDPLLKQEGRLFMAPSLPEILGLTTRMAQLDSHPTCDASRISRAPGPLISSSSGIARPHFVTGNATADPPSDDTPGMVLAVGNRSRRNFATLTTRGIWFLNQSQRLVQCPTASPVRRGGFWLGRPRCHSTPRERRGHCRRPAACRPEPRTWW